MSKSFASKRDTICPCCGRELTAHHVRDDTRTALEQRKAARAAQPYGSPEHVMLLEQQAREIVRILLTRKRAAAGERDVRLMDRKKLH